MIVAGSSGRGRPDQGLAGDGDQGRAGQRHRVQENGPAGPRHPGYEAGHQETQWREQRATAELGHRPHRDGHLAVPVGREPAEHRMVQQRDPSPVQDAVEQAGEGQRGATDHDEPGGEPESES